jgi:hypothetical protein
VEEAATASSEESPFASEVLWIVKGTGFFPAVIEQHASSRATSFL